MAFKCPDVTHHCGSRRAPRGHCARCSPEAAWAALLCTSCATRSITCPRKVDDDCLQELRWIYDRRDLAEARQRSRGLAGQVVSRKYPKLTGWVEDNHRGDADLLPTAAPAS